jgi:hypothetical protein
MGWKPFPVETWTFRHLSRQIVDFIVSFWCNSILVPMFLSSFLNILCKKGGFEMMHKSLLKKLGLVVVVVALVVGCGAGQGYQSTSQGPLGLTDKSKTGISFWDGKYSCNDNGHCPFRC